MHRPRYIVYGLVDPRSGELRYVGQTKHPLVRRLKEHFWHARRGDDAYVYRWIRSLAREPDIFEVEETPSKRELDAAERFHIAYFRSIGCRLTNTSAGGDGRVGPCSEEHKRKISKANRGKRHTSDARLKMALAHRGQPSPNRGRVWSAEYRAKMTAARGGRRLVDENGVIYESANDAARRLSVHVGSVSRAAHCGLTAGGHTFKYLET